MTIRQKFLTIIFAGAALTGYAADAATNWTDSCAKCHGAEGKGDTKMGKKLGIANYEKSIQTGFREVADSLAARSGLAERIAATESLVAAQQKRTDLATARYNKGVDSYFEVLNATLDLFAARQRLIQLRLARAVNSVELYKALGGGW